MAAIVIAVAVSGFLIWQSTLSDTDAEGFARGNGRIEAVEIDVAAKLPGRIDTGDRSKCWGHAALRSGGFGFSRLAT